MGVEWKQHQETSHRYLSGLEMMRFQRLFTSDWWGHRRDKLSFQERTSLSAAVKSQRVSGKSHSFWLELQRCDASLRAPSCSTLAVRHPAGLHSLRTGNLCTDPPLLQGSICSFEASRCGVFYWGLIKTKASNFMQNWIALQFIRLFILFIQCSKNVIFLLKVWSDRKRKMKEWSCWLCPDCKKLWKAEISSDKNKYSDLNFCSAFKSAFIINHLHLNPVLVKYLLFIFINLKPQIIVANLNMLIC